jgi:hypothetical protein
MKAEELAPASPTMEVSNLFVLTSYASLFLRKVTVFTYPPAFILCLIHGIVSGCAVPALGLIPAFGSSLLGASLMYRDKVTFGGSPVIIQRGHVCVCDFILAVGLLIILIISWVVVPHFNRYEGSQIMLGTYATVPLMVNLCVSCPGCCAAWRID